MSSEDDTFVPPDGPAEEAPATPPEPEPEPAKPKGKQRRHDTEEEDPDDSVIWRCTGCSFATRYESQLERNDDKPKERYCPHCHSQAKTG